MKKANKTFVQLKVFTDRARMYLGYINFFLLNFVFMKSMDIDFLNTDNHYLQVTIYAILIVAGTLAIILIGYLDHVLGIRKEEMQNVADNNPFAIKVLEDLEDLKADIKSLVDHHESLNNTKSYAEDYAKS